MSYFTLLRRIESKWKFLSHTWKLSNCDINIGRSMYCIIFFDFDEIDDPSIVGKLMKVIYCGG